MNAENARLQEAGEQKAAWKKWGPYLSERQWGTVREDYSENGDAWNYFTHDHARSRAYRWGEDGLAGMCFFWQNMLEIALELAKHDPGYQDIAAKFVEHFLWIAVSMDRVGIHEDELWDEEDGFFYDVIRLPDGSVQRVKLRSMVGLMPLCATAVIPPDMTTKFPEFAKRLENFLDRHRTLMFYEK